MVSGGAGRRPELKIENAKLKNRLALHVPLTAAFSIFNFQFSIRATAEARIAQRIQSAAKWLNDSLSKVAAGSKARSVRVETRTLRCRSWLRAC
jgi:hypothetical protein